MMLTTACTLVCSLQEVCEASPLAQVRASRAELACVDGRVFSSAFSSWAVYTAAMRVTVLSQEAGAPEDVCHRTTEVSIPEAKQNTCSVQICAC